MFIVAHYTSLKYTLESNHGLVTERVQYPAGRYSSSLAVFQHVKPIRDFRWKIGPQRTITIFVVNNLFYRVQQNKF